MFGLQIAFKKYSAKLGIWGSKWIGLDNFNRIFISPDAIRSIKNTLIISFERLIFEFPVPIILAMLINEMPGRKLKRTYQTILTFPHFLSWVIVASILNNFLANTGALNALIVSLGGKPISFLATPEIFRPILYITANWKHMGYSSIIYIAAIAGISSELYEAAIMDGAGKLKQMFYVTIPGIMPTIITMLILKIGNMMNLGFEKIFLLYNSSIYETADVISTYVYRKGIGDMNYSFSTAVGLFNSIINLLLLVGANKLCKKFTARLEGEYRFRGSKKEGAVELKANDGFNIRALVSYNVRF